MIDGTDISCGVYQLSGLSIAPKRLIQEAWNENKGGEEWGEEFIHLIFSDAVTRPGGTRLAKVIRKEKLGHLQATRSRKNPNSSNNIKTWIWSVNWNAVEKYLK